MAVDPRKAAAAKILSQGGRQSTAAGAAGVARSSVLRWLKEDDFCDLVQGYRDHPDQDRPKTLEDLVPEAHALLAEAMRNDGSVSAARAKIALDILKAAEVTARSSDLGSKGGLAARLEALDDSGSSD